MSLPLMKAPNDSIPSNKLHVIKYFDLSKYFEAVSNQVMPNKLKFVTEEMPFLHIRDMMSSIHQPFQRPI